MPHTAIEIDSLTVEALTADAAWWALYDASFPAAEREPRAVILTSLRRGLGLALRARAADRTVGLATTHLLLSPPAVFLVYLAVAPTLQSQGLGRRLVEAAWSSGATHLQTKGLDAQGLVTEVDSVEQDPTNTCARRVAFFNRQGLHVLSHHYRQPPLDGLAPVPMWLLYRHAFANSAPPPVDALVRAIYVEKYAAMNGIPRALLTGMLEDSPYGI